MSAQCFARTTITHRGCASLVQIPRPLFSLRVAGLECIVGAWLFDLTNPQKGLWPGLGAARSTPRGVPLVESADERKTRERQKSQGVCPGQGVERREQGSR